MSLYKYKVKKYVLIFFRDWLLSVYKLISSNCCIKIFNNEHITYCYDLKLIKVNWWSDIMFHWWVVDFIQVSNRNKKMNMRTSLKICFKTKNSLKILIKPLKTNWIKQWKKENNKSWRMINNMKKPNKSLIIKRNKTLKTYWVAKRKTLIKHFKICLKTTMLKLKQLILQSIQTKLNLLSTHFQVYLKGEGRDIRNNMLKKKKRKKKHNKVKQKIHLKKRHSIRNNNKNNNKKKQSKNQHHNKMNNKNKLLNKKCIGLPK